MGVPFQQEIVNILIFVQDFEDLMQYHFLQTEQDTSHILVPHKKVHLLEIDSCGYHCSFFFESGITNDVVITSAAFG